MECKLSHVNQNWPHPIIYIFPLIDKKWTRCIRETCSQFGLARVSGVQCYKILWAWFSQIAKVRGDCASRGSGRMRYILVHNWQSQVTAISQYSSGRCFTSIRDGGDAVHNKTSMTQSAVHMVQYHNLPHIPLILFDTPWRVQDLVFICSLFTPGM